MNYLFKCVFLFLIVIAVSCKMQPSEKLSEEGIWQLGWRMTESFYLDNYDLAEVQFDSLITLSDSIKPSFLIIGLELLEKNASNDKMIEIFNTQSDFVKEELCAYNLLKTNAICMGFKPKEVSNKAFQLELVKLFYQDQFIRSARNDELLKRYDLEKEDVIPEKEHTLSDESISTEFKSLVSNYGFPTKAQVGTDGMNTVFVIIQHADDDVEWRREQFPKVENAVKNGDLSAMEYAYMLDRNNTRIGEPQKFGTQFKKVDGKKGIAELFPVEDIENLDARRRALGMEPIAMYKRTMLRHSQR